MKDLFDRIIAWGSDKFVGLEYQPLPQIGFLIKELAEVNDEFINGDIDAAVGEICDIIVFSVNALVLLPYSKFVFEYQVVPKPQYFSKAGIVAGILYLISNIGSQSLVDRDFRQSRILPNKYFDLIESCCTFIQSLGYSPELALLETVKKIESREGAFNPDSGKWEKTATHYKPDYSKARLK